MRSPYKLIDEIGVPTEDILGWNSIPNTKQYEAFVHG